MPELTVLLSDLPNPDRRLVGGKAVNIARMMNAGFPVPSGFCITTAAYRRQVNETAIGQDLQTLIAAAGTAPERLSDALRAKFLTEPVLPDVELTIRAAYRELGEDAHVAVRSSATAEDVPDASFAGQQDSFLGVHDERALLEAVRACWASLWNSRAIQYREARKVPHSSVAMAVVVQQMIAADVAGVMFTADPATSSREELTIAACYGLGEGVVSGLVTPDTYVVAKRRMTISRASIGTKEQKVVQQDQGTILVPVGAAERQQPCMADSTILDIARLGIAVDRHYGRPQDIEWAVTDDCVYLLQTRPVTTLLRLAHTYPTCQGPRRMCIGGSILGGYLDSLDADSSRWLGITSLIRCVRSISTTCSYRPSRGRGELPASLVFACLWM